MFFFPLLQNLTFKCVFLLTYFCKVNKDLIVISQIIHWLTNLIPSFHRIWIYFLTLMKVKVFFKLALTINEVEHIYYQLCRVILLQWCIEDVVVQEESWNII